MPRAPKQFLWLLTGSIGDALMALAVCAEAASFDPEARHRFLVRRNSALIAALGASVPSVAMSPANLKPRHLARTFAWALRPGVLMSAWKYERGWLRVVRDVAALRSPMVARFDVHKPVSAGDTVASFDYSALMIDNFRRLAQAAGLRTKPIGSPASLPIATYAPRGFEVRGPYIVLHPFGSTGWKTLKKERARAVVEGLRATYPEHIIMVTGAAQDGAVAYELVEGVENARAMVSLPILELAGLIKGAALYLGVDTGITHLAAMMGQRVLALEHPTHPRWFPTYNPNTTMLLCPPGIEDLELSAEQIVGETKKLLG